MSQRPIVTPEAVPLELEPAGIGSRFLALMLDWLIQGIAAFALLFGFVAVANASDLSGGIAQAGFFLLGFLLLFGYPVAQETLWRGRTVGKAALGLRVVTVEGAPVRFRHAAIRALLGLVDFALTSGAGAVLSVLVTARNQRLGDLAAGTMVLRERSGLPAPSAVTFTVPAHLDSYAATLDVTSLGDADYRPVRAFLMRASQLPAAVRYDLAVQLANPLAARVRPPPPPGTQPEMFLTCVAAVYQRRQRGTAEQGAEQSVAPGGTPAGPPQAPPPAGPQPPAGAGSPETGAGSAESGTGFAPMS